MMTSSSTFPDDEDGPVFMDNELKTVGAIASISDFRPAVGSDQRPVYHNTLHQREESMITYLGLLDLLELTTIALCGPVIKYTFVGNALLTVSADGGFPTPLQLDEICSYALAFLFNRKTKKNLPETLEKVKARYRNELTYASVAKSKALANTKHRGEIVAAVVISFYNELRACADLSAREYEIKYMPYVLEMENSNPWGAEVYIIPVVPLPEISWPDWGPVESACPCNEHGGAGVMEHEIELYHRVLSLLRYAVQEFHPKRYLDPNTGLGRPILGRIKAQVAIKSIRKIKLLQKSQTRFNEVLMMRHEQKKQKAEEEARALEAKEKSNSDTGNITDSLGRIDLVQAMEPLPEPGDTEIDEVAAVLDLLPELRRKRSGNGKLQRKQSWERRQVHKMIQTAAYEVNKHERRKETTSDCKTEDPATARQEQQDIDKNGNPEKQTDRLEQSMASMLSHMNLSGQSRENELASESELEATMEKILRSACPAHEQQSEKGASNGNKSRQKMTEAEELREAKLERIIQMARREVKLDEYPFMGSDEEKEIWVMENLEPYREVFEAVAGAFGNEEISKFVAKLFSHPTQFTVQSWARQAAGQTTLEELHEAEKKKKNKGKAATGAKGPALSTSQDGRIRDAFVKMDQEAEKRQKQQRPTQASQHSGSRHGKENKPAAAPLQNSQVTKVTKTADRDAEVLAVLDEISRARVTTGRFPYRGTDEEKKRWFEEGRDLMFRIIDAAGIPQHERKAAGEDFSYFVAGNMTSALLERMRVRDETELNRGVLDEFKKELYGRLPRLSDGAKDKVFESLADIGSKVRMS